MYKSLARPKGLSKNAQQITTYDVHNKHASYRQQIERLFYSEAYRVVFCVFLTFTTPFAIWS